MNHPRLHPDKSGLRCGQFISLLALNILEKIFSEIMTLPRCLSFTNEERGLRCFLEGDIRIVLQGAVREQIFMIAAKKPYSVAALLVNHKYLLTVPRRY